MDFHHVARLLEALERENVRYAVFGAAALNLHGLARFTDHLDLFIGPEAANVERLKRALASVFVDPSISEISADDLLGEYPAVQYVPPEGTFHVAASQPGEVRLEALSDCGVQTEMSTRHEGSVGRRRGNDGAQTGMSVPHEGALDLACPVATSSGGCREEALRRYRGDGGEVGRGRNASSLHRKAKS